MMMIMPTQHIFDAFLRMALSLFNGVQALGSTTFKTHFHPGDQITMTSFKMGMLKTEKPAHRETITQSSFYTKQLLHTDASTDRRF